MLEPICGPCIGIGQAPTKGEASVRTFNRNFPGRSGTAEDRVYLCSPSTAAATALSGEITDPRTLGPPPAITPAAGGRPDGGGPPHHRRPARRAGPRASRSSAASSLVAPPLPEPCPERGRRAGSRSSWATTSPPATWPRTAPSACRCGPTSRPARTTCSAASIPGSTSGSASGAAGSSWAGTTTARARRASRRPSRRCTSASGPSWRRASPASTGATSSPRASSRCCSPTTPTAGGSRSATGGGSRASAPPWSRAARSSTAHVEDGPEIALRLVLSTGERATLAAGGLLRQVRDGGRARVAGEVPGRGRPSRVDLAGQQLAAAAGPPSGASMRKPSCPYGESITRSSPAPGIPAASSACCSDRVEPVGAHTGHQGPRA